MEIYVQVFNCKIHEVTCFTEEGLVSRVKVTAKKLQPLKPTSDTFGYLKLKGYHGLHKNVERELLSSLHKIEKNKFRTLRNKFREVNLYK